MQFALSIILLLAMAWGALPASAPPQAPAKDGTVTVLDDGTPWPPKSK
jgi:hypothetical protein